MKSSLSKIMTAAWEIFKSKSNLVSSFSEALKMAWKAFKFKKALFMGIVNFSFTKKDGTTREAAGTRNFSNFLYSCKGSGKKAPAHMVRYWDLDKDAWRTCNIFKIISIS